MTTTLSSIVLLYYCVNLWSTTNYQVFRICTDCR